MIISKQKLSITLQLLKYSPILVLRYFKFVILKRQLVVNSFKATNNYCINGALNQLIWDVENSLFTIVEGTSKVHLNTQDFIFKVDENQTHFSLKVYGFNRKVIEKTSIKVVALIEAKLLKHRTSAVKKYNPKFNKLQKVNFGLKKIDKTASIKFKPIKISAKIDKLKVLDSPQPIDKLDIINNYQTLDQLNNHNYE